MFLPPSVERDQDLWSARASAATSSTTIDFLVIVAWIAVVAVYVRLTMAPAVLNGHMNGNGAKHASTTAQVSIRDRVALQRLLLLLLLLRPLLTDDPPPFLLL